MCDKEQFLDIPLDRFTVDIESKFLFNLIENAICKAGKTSELSKVLIEKHGLGRYSQRSLSDNLRKWQKQRHKIYLDYFLSIGDFCDIKKEIIFSKIKSIKLPRGKVPLKTTYPIKVNKAWGFVSECIRVEGNLSKVKKRIILENTDMDLIQEFKKCAEEIGISNFRQDLRIKVMVPSDNELSEIKVVNMKTNKEKMIYERILKLKKGIKKEIIFIEPRIKIGESFNYLIKLKSTQFKVHVYVPTFGKIEGKSNLKTNLSYQKVTSSFIITIGNSSLHHILHKAFQIQIGNKSCKIFISQIIKQFPKDVLKGVVSAVLAAESTIVVGGRRVMVTSLSKRYIKDFQELLLKFNITSSIDYKQTTLSVYGYKNFEKINKNFGFILESKIESFNSLLKNIILQSPKGLSKVLYLKSLLELGMATSVEMRNNVGRLGNSFRQYISELLNMKYIEVMDQNWPRKYRITENGKKYLNENITYWLD